MKILIISDAWFPQVNGVVRTYEYLGAALRDRGHEVKVIGPAEFPLRMPMLGYSEIELVIAPRRRLIAKIKAYAPDHIHISTEGPLGWTARKYCTQNNIPFSTSFHTQFPDYISKRVAKFIPALENWSHEKAKAWVRKFHAPASVMFVATKSLERTLTSWGFKNRMHHLTRGAKLELFKPGKKTRFTNLKTPIALYVGRIAVEKSVEDFLKMEWDGEKVIIGDGPDREALEKTYKDAHFLGTKTGEELAQYYRSADLFVFPSRTDTFGIVLIEALASGLPVAGYNVTGPVDIITDKFLGALHEDDLSIAAKNARTQGTAKQRADHVKSYYTWENAAMQYETAITKIAKHHHSL